MLKIVYPICCGMDVHKSFLVACIASTNECGVTTYKSRRFSTFTKDLRLCADWLSANNCKDVCMESTGIYWIPIYNILEASCKIVLAHPKYVKAIRGKKTDKKDAKWIADIFKHDLVSGSFIPPADIRQLRDLVRYRSLMRVLDVVEYGYITVWALQGKLSHWQHSLQLLCHWIFCRLPKEIVTASRTFLYSLYSSGERH